MSGYRPGFRLGDRYVEIAGVRTCLRLSVSALAEMASTLEAQSPSELAARLRHATSKDWNIILRAVATPRPREDLSDSEISELLPILSAVISAGLAP